MGLWEIFIFYFDLSAFSKLSIINMNHLKHPSLFSQHLFFTGRCSLGQFQTLDLQEDIWLFLPYHGFLHSIIMTFLMIPFPNQTPPALCSTIEESVPLWAHLPWCYPSVSWCEVVSFLKSSHCKKYLKLNFP